MSTKSRTAAVDPTFESQGPMGILFANKTDLGMFNSNPIYGYVQGVGIPGSGAQLSYSPTPPSTPWTPGTNWKGLPVSPLGAVVPSWQFPVQSTLNGDEVTSMFGSLCVLGVVDRSSSQVALGESYILDLQFIIGGTYMSMHFAITGVAGGSTVSPGFGLMNVGSKPGWTYYLATAFHDTWSLQLRSDDFLDFATLSVTYVPYSSLNTGGSMSRLFYSISGSCPNGNTFSRCSPASADQTIVPEKAPKAHSAIEIVLASTKYKEYRR
jgi:hypothetical protein